MLKALDTDLEWHQEHTRLLTRAKEWDKEGRDSSFLLRGKDLEAAEESLHRAAGKEPEPTTLQSQYITASRKAERKPATPRWRVSVGAVMLGSIGWLMAIILVYYAYSQ